MFSGITNQFTSLVAAAKGGQADEDVPAPDVSAAPAAAPEIPATVMEHQDPNVVAGEQPVDGEEAAKRSSDSLVDSFMAEATGWLGSAKGWLGSASIPSMPAMPTMAMPTMPTMPSIPSIPGLRKGGAEAGEGGDVVPGEGQGIDPASVVSGDEEDKSRYISATEGADSHPASGGGTPTGDEGQIGQGKKRRQCEEVKITTKVTQQAKHFGSFLSSAINKAGAKIKETVKDNTILDSFNKEQEAFIKGQGGSDSGAAPWIGLSNEAKIKEEILGLSQDRRNFVRAPPAGVDFEFNYDTAYPTAIAIMAEDKALETMRFELVPKIITEENFWRNYFYRVSLIIQAAELGTLGVDGVGQASSEDVLNTKNSKTYLKPATTNNVSNEANSVAISSQPKSSKMLKAHSADSEFVSDTFQTTNETDLAEVKDGMRRLGIDSMTRQALEEQKEEEDNEEQWEKDLEAELKDYEVVSDAGGSRVASGTRKTKGDDHDAADDDDIILPISNLRTRSTNNDWEEYADLIEDTDDLK